MKKFSGGILALAMAFFTCSGIYGQQTGLDEILFNKSEKFQSYTEKQYSVSSKFGKYYKKLQAKTVYSYNQNGEPVLVRNYDEEDVCSMSILYEYDENGRLVLQRNFNSNEEAWMKIEFSYDEKGRLSVMDTTEENVLKERIIYEYEGEKTIQSQYDSEGALENRTIFREKNSVLSQMEVYKKSGELDELYLYSYDAGQNLVQVDTFDKDQQVKNTDLFLYDDNGKVREIQSFDGNGAIYERKKLKFDEKGNVTDLYVYSVADKFGGITNELKEIFTFTYKY